MKSKFSFITLLFAAILAVISQAALAQTAVYPSVQSLINKVATYSAAVNNFTLAASPTDVCIIPGNASNTVYIKSISISGVKTTSGTTTIVLVKRSTANTGGSANALTSVAMDSGNAAASSVFSYYTANPTTGTLVGNISARQVAFLSNTATTDMNRTQWIFGDWLDQYAVLRGVAQSIAVNLAGVTQTGGTLSCEVEWMER